MKKRKLPILARVALLLGAMLVVLWVFRIPLAESLLRARLADVGIPATNLEITSLSPWRIDIRNLRLADGNRLRHGEARIEWPILASPRIARVVLTGLELELGVSPTGLAFQGAAGDERIPVAEGLARLPEIRVRDAVARITGPDDAIVAEIVVPSFSFELTPDLSGNSSGPPARWAAEVKTELVSSHLRAHGWVVTDGVFSSAGRLERREGQLHYRPHGCEQASLTGLQREHIAVSGALAVCLKAGGQEPAVVVGRDGRIALDLIAEPGTAQLGLDVAALPSIPLELDGGSLYLRLSREAEGSLLGSLGLRELNLRLPAAGMAFDGLEIAATTGPAELASRGGSFTLAARAIRQLAEIPALRPMALEGRGNWAPQALVFDATLRQSPAGLGASLHLHRDSETGEGEVSFGISPLEFGQGGLHADEISPLLARHVTGLSGEIEASGRILFNDAWATPLQITGTAHKLVVGMKPSLSPLTDGAVTVDFGRSRFDISLPPLSPERGWAMLDVIDGGLRYGDVDLRGSTGPVNFLSLWPLSCRPAGQPGTAVADPGDGVTATIVGCLHEALTAGQ